MQTQFSRTRLLLGTPAIHTLHAARVAVFGVGGVGGYVIEVLARSGVGTIDIIDNDRVCLTNINRQLLATHATLNQYKVDVAEQRIHDINPQCRVNKYPLFYLPNQAEKFPLQHYDYVVDCIDTVTAKLDLIRRCKAMNIPILCCMGAGNKVDATQFMVTDIHKTYNDPIARVIRNKLRREHIKHLKVVYSPEEPLKTIGSPEETTHKHTIPASNAWVPATAGLIAGGEVVKDLILRAGTYRICPEEEGNSPAAKQAASKAQLYLSAKQ